MQPEKRFFNFAVWIIAVMVLSVLLTSCNPYQGLQEVPTATNTAKATSIPTSTKIKTPTSTPVICNVHTGVPGGSLNIRTNAGTSYAAIGLLREGQAVTVIDRVARGNWIQIKTAGVIGWINSNYCKIGE